VDSRRASAPSLLALASHGGHPMARRGPHGSNGGGRGSPEPGVGNTYALRRLLLGVLAGAALVVIFVHFRPGAGLLCCHCPPHPAHVLLSASRGWTKCISLPGLSAEAPAH